MAMELLVICELKEHFADLVCTINADPLRTHSVMKLEKHFLLVVPKRRIPQCRKSFAETIQW